MATEPTLYLNAAGDLVPSADLDEAERRFYQTPAPWEVAVFGLTLREYVHKWQTDAALSEAHFEDALIVPDER